MKNIPITLTLPEDVIWDLHLYVSRRQMSKFVAHLVAQGLEEKKELIAKEFKEAALDSERNSEIELWDKLIGDGSNALNR